MLEDPVLFSLVLESPGHMRVLWEVRKEVAALLSPVCSHTNIVQLIGVILDAHQRPVKLLFEPAHLGDLNRWVGGVLSSPRYDSPVVCVDVHVQCEQCKFWAAPCFRVALLDVAMPQWRSPACA
jgi:hypothetical protein